MFSAPRIQRKASTAATVHLALCFYFRTTISTASLHLLTRFGASLQCSDSKELYLTPTPHYQASVDVCVVVFFLCVSVVRLPVVCSLLCSVKTHTASCPHTPGCTMPPCPSSHSPLEGRNRQLGPLSPPRNLYLLQSSWARAKTSCAD